MALFPVNPLTLPIVEALTQRNIRIGPHPDMRINVYKADAPGVHAVCVFAHGGGGVSAEQTTEFESPVKKPAVLGRCLQNPALYGIDDFPIDVVSVRYPMVVRNDARQAPYSSIYEATIEGVPGGHGPVSWPGYAPLMMESIQRAIQWCGDNALTRGWNPDQIAFWGASIGFTAGAAAAYGPSRPFAADGTASARFAYRSTSTPRCILNWYGPASVNPNKLYFGSGGPYIGFAASVPKSVQSDTIRALLVPKPDGTFPPDAAERPLCVLISPLSRIALNRPEHAAIPLHSYYWADELITTPGPFYSTSPPYVQPHDPRWFKNLHDACAVAGIPHSGRVLDDADYSGGVLEMWESTVVETKDFFKATMSF
jgi:hypothetical protein